jgi:hypothetical protein
MTVGSVGAGSWVSRGTTASSTDNNGGGSPRAHRQRWEGERRLDTSTLSYGDLRVINSRAERRVRRKDKGAREHALHVRIRIVPDLG